MNRLLNFAILALITSSAALAAELPEPSVNDARVRYVAYHADDVTIVNVRRGAVTRIVLANDEKIIVAATGFAANCKKPEMEWCVHADVGTNEIWVKPKDNATYNNLELRTDMRDYSFEFHVLPNAIHGRSHGATTQKALMAEPMFRVIFRYPPHLPPMPSITASMLPQPAVSDRSSASAALQERLTLAKPVPRNWKYSMQVLDGSNEIAPSMVFDDGRFTYFRFPANREVPTIYCISPDGEESRVNFHMEGDLEAVERLGHEFVLRLGKAAVGVWNDAYDADGIPPKDGTTVPGVVRTIR